jgi:hypothetical protein
MMSELLEDNDNLKLLEELTSDNAVSVNISGVSKILGNFFRIYPFFYFFIDDFIIHTYF